jgi:hypothetical protein
MFMGLHYFYQFVFLTQKTVSLTLMRRSIADSRDKTRFLSHLRFMRYWDSLITHSPFT